MYQTTMSSNKRPADPSLADDTMIIASGKLCLNRCGHKHCRKKELCILHYAPEPSQYKKQFKQFVEACFNGDIDAIKKLKMKHCKKCRDRDRKTKTQGNGVEASCYKELRKIKDEMQDIGCQRCGCFDGDVLDADHPGRLNKEMKVSNYKYFASKYKRDGPQKMREEFGKTNVLCRNCHLLEGSHNAYKGADSSLMPTNTEKEKQAKRMRIFKEVNQAYNREKKRERSCCFHCKEEVTMGNEVMFQWAHKDECDKEGTVAKLCEGATISAIPKIDREVSVSELKCANCHTKFDTIPRSQTGRKQWEELIERGVPKPKDWDSWQQKA